MELLSRPRVRTGLAAGPRRPAANRPHGHGRGRGGGGGSRPRVQPRRRRRQGAGRGRRAAAGRLRRRRHRRSTSTRCAPTWRPGCAAGRCRCPRRSSSRSAIESGGETVGAALALGTVGPEAPDLLHAVSVAVLTELAMADARARGRGEPARVVPRAAAQRSGRRIADDVLRRAARFGCDLSRGAVALCAEPTGERVRHLVALVADEAPGALAQLADDGRVYGLVPPAGRRGRGRVGDDPRPARGGAPAPARLGRPVLVLRGPGHAEPRAGGGGAGARRRAPGRRARRGRRRRRHLPAAVPRPGLPPGGGPVLLRRHDRAAGRATTSSTARTWSARWRRGSSTTARPSQRPARSSSTATPSPTGSSA